MLAADVILFVTVFLIALLVVSWIKVVDGLDMNSGGAGILFFIFLGLALLIGRGGYLLAGSVY